MRSHLPPFRLCLEHGHLEDRRDPVPIRTCPKFSPSGGETGRRAYYGLPVRPVRPKAIDAFIGIHTYSSGRLDDRASYQTAVARPSIPRDS
jgi:hypothetical protein